MPRFLLTTLLAILLPTGAFASAIKPEKHYSRIAQMFSEQFPYVHLNRMEMDNTIATRTWTNYISSLDYNRVYFLQTDIDSFHTYSTTLDDSLKKGDLDFAYKVFDIFKKRVDDRFSYTKTLLDKKPDFTTHESYKWKRKDATWPQNKEELDEIWRKKIKNEYLQRVIVRELAEKKKKSDKEKDQSALNEDNLPPEEFILKRYKQYLTVLNDSDSEWILQKYLSACAQAYDPHSQYMSPSEVADFYIGMKLSLEGIGAVLSPEDGAAKIVRLIKGGPAQSDTRDIRLQEGDKIIAVAQDNEPTVQTLHWPLNKVVKLIRGPKGTRVVLTVASASDPSGLSTRKVDIIRDKVKLEEQAAKHETREVESSDGKKHKLSVITLPAFYANMESAGDRDARSASSDVQQFLREAAKNADGVILDLRANGGGSLWEAVRMTGLFISTGPAVQVKDRIHLLGMDKYRLSPLYDNDPLVAYSGPMLVLLNRLSASASEILAGAMQDYGRAVIVGDSKTHGKGTVQTVLDINTNDMRFGKIKITTANYYRISGSSTQKKGVAPDILVPSPWDYIQDIGEDFKENAIPWSLEKPASYSPVDDLSLYIPSLREMSEKRRAGNSRFNAYISRLELLEKHSVNTELSLNINERRKQAKMEKELSDMQKELLSDAKDEKKNQDLVLNESLQILADLVTLCDLKHDTASQAGKKKTLAQKITDWCKKHL